MPNPTPPCNRGKRFIKINALTMAQLMKHLMEGIYSCKELAAETGLHYVTVLHYTREMYRAGVLHIAKWERCAYGKDQVKIYKFGSKPDATRQRLTDVEKLKRYREKKRQMALLHRLAGAMPCGKPQECMT